MANPTEGKVRNPNSVHFTQKDMGAAIAFYRDTLGFQLDECWPDEKKPMWASLSLDGQTVMIGAAMPPEAMAECSDPEVLGVHKAQAEDWANHKPGVGVQTYVMVPDVDSYHQAVAAKGSKPLTRPTTQFYGLRDFMVEDPSGYRLIFYSLAAMASCQSCGMPLKDSQPGQMYCHYCTDDAGKLKSYEQVFEGTVQGYFMGMQKMPRTEAEKAAREHLRRMPAWQARSG